MRRFLFLLLLFGLMACSPTTAVSPEQSEPELAEAVDEVAVEPTNTAVVIEPTAPPVIELATVAPAESIETDEAATAEPPPEPEPTEVADGQIESGRTADGAYYLGSPSAPIRMIDYSDFL